MGVRSVVMSTGRFIVFDEIRTDIHQSDTSASDGQMEELKYTNSVQSAALERPTQICAIVWESITLSLLQILMC